MCTAHDELTNCGRNSSSAMRAAASLSYTWQLASTAGRKQDARMTCVHPDIPHAVAARSSSRGRRVAVSARTCRIIRLSSREIQVTRSCAAAAHKMRVHRSSNSPKVAEVSETSCCQSTVMRTGMLTIFQKMDFIHHKKNENALQL